MTQENTKTSFDVYIGIDWAEEKHDFFIRHGQDESHHVVKAGAEPMSDFMDGVCEKFRGLRLAIAMECKKGPLVNFLRKYPEITLFEINPLSLSQYRKAFRVSAAKDDKSDARFICEMFYKNVEYFTALDFSDGRALQLGELSEKRRRFVNDRTKQTNRLRQVLKKSFPQALDFKLIGEFIYCAMACDFLDKWSSLDDVKNASEQEIYAFYMAHQCKRKDVIKKRLKAIKSAINIMDDTSFMQTYAMEIKGIICIVRALNKTIALYDKKIEALVDEHEDTEIFLSFPGMGKNFAARMIHAFGSNRSKYKDVSEFINMIGVSPVCIQSGKGKLVRRRYAKPRFIHQTFVEYAGYAMMNCAWSKQFRLQKIDKGQKGFRIRRALAYKWARILFACWKERKPYDDIQYVNSMKKRNSPYVMSAEFFQGKYEEKQA